MSIYRLGLYEKSMPQNLDWEEKLSIAKENGFDWLEISIDESDYRLNRLWDNKEQKDILTAEKNSGLNVRTMCLSGHRKYPMGSIDKATREKSLSIMERAIEFSASLGIRIIQLAGYDVYYEKSTEETKKYFVEGLFKSCEFAAKYGVVLGFETMETAFMDTVEKAMYYVNTVNSPYLQLYPDIGNLTNAVLLYNTSVCEDMDKGKGHIVAVHLKETTPGIYRDMTFGAGHVDFYSVIKKAWELGARQFTGEFWYKDGMDYQNEIKTSAEFLRAYITQMEKAAIE
ncbi:MAG: L-ribulose-5-phosphate 3-epimerase [Oscillospiraceae bacterium]|nr:L-ribulose-5-phosphate 3-epimerase [Oscillospiraceae bacterium]